MPAQATLSTSPLSIVSRRIDSLRQNSHNPRLHGPRQIHQIAKSIVSFGFNVPILIDSGQNIIAGHGRVLAAIELGLTEVPTVCLDHLSEAQARAFMIADNRLAEISSWDNELLASQLKELSVIDLGFSLDATGFDMGEIDFRIEAQVEAPKADALDELPPALNGPPTSQLGDLWLLGPHRLYCGNSLDPTAYLALMSGQKAAVVFADPPYNVPIAGHVSGLGSIRHREFAMASGEMDPAEFIQFLTQSFSHLVDHSIDGSIHFLCMDWRHCTEILAAGQQTYAELKNICVWVKHNAGMGSQYRSQHEFVFVFKNGRAPHRNNIELGRFGRHRSNVWNYPGATSFQASGDEGNLLALHPTVKPTALVADAIMDCSARGDLVLDIFLGSGTTIMAAEQTGRRCFGIEIDPHYADTAIRRWQFHTGLKATHAASGVLFDVLAEDKTDDR